MFLLLTGRICLAVGVVLCFAWTPTPAHAAEAGLVKGSSAAVYYAATDGGRYAFPNEKTFRTWFADFSSVRTISDQALAALPLRANVTYRPGVRLVKITTDPRVYAVARGAVLRWVQTESLARALYGDAWAGQVDDLPDAFFSHYSIGEPVAAPGAYDPAAERAAAATIEADKGLPTPAAGAVPGVLRTVRVASVSALRDAVNQARPGDQIRIAPGAYVLDRQLWIDVKGAADHPISVMADGPRGSASFTATGEESFNVGGGAAYLVFDGFEVHHTRGDVFHVQDGAHHITLRNLDLHDAGPDGDVLKINQAHHVTVEGCDLARPGRRAAGNPAVWQEAIDLVDVDDAVIRRNFIHDVGNMAGYVKGGSKRALIEDNVIDGQRGGIDGNPVWGIGGWTDRELLEGESYEAIGTVFRHNVIAHAAYGALALFDAQDSLIENNLFLNNAAVLVQSREGNAPRASTDGVMLRGNRFVDTAGRMPTVCERLNHGLSGVTASGNTYWNNGRAVPTAAGCGFVPGQESGAAIRDPGIGDFRPAGYAEAMAWLGRT